MGRASAGGGSISLDGARAAVTSGGATNFGKGFLAGFGLGFANGLGFSGGACATGSDCGAGAGTLAAAWGLTTAWGLTAAWGAGSGSKGSTGTLAFAAAASRTGVRLSETKRPAMRN